MPATLEDLQSAAYARPILGDLEALAREVRRLLGYDPRGERPYLTARMAKDRTGVNPVSVLRAADGYPVSQITLIRLARGLDGDAHLLLRLGGFRVSDYAHLAPDGAELPGGPDDGEDPEEAELGQGAREMLAIYRSLPPPGRRLLLTTARAVLEREGELGKGR